MAEFLNIGKLIAIHGLKGELLLKHTLGKKSSLKGLKAVYIEEKKNAFIPWFIESTRIRNEESTFIKFEGIDSRETASRLAQKQVWIPEDEFKRLSAKSAPANLLGYTVINHGETLSEVIELIEQPHQLLCRLNMKGKEVLIPLHQDTLRKIDHNKKMIFVELPEGLLDIYLS